MALLTAALIIAPTLSAQQTCVTEPKPNCRAKAKFDLAFLIDSSGSISQRGQTYNIEIQGVARALRDQTVIPTDGTVAVTVLTFNGGTVENVPIAPINSAADAEALALQVDLLNCPNIGDQTGSCPRGDTNYRTAILTADTYLNKNGTPGARRVLLMSSDGEPTDADQGVGAAEQVRLRAAADGILSELDVILIGLFAGTSELQTNKARVDRIVFPQPTADLPGATLVINAGECNLPGASLDTADCDRQVNEFADLTRRVLRSYVPPIKLIVTTAADTDPDQPVSGGNGLPELSLRQAIELANCNQGAATITFAESLRGKTIRPRIPLPALTAPEIRIDGCAAAGCAAAVTIDGALTATSQGERHRDGLLIRSSRETVRGLKIINFKRAGIEIAPTCPFDIVGHSLIELNTLENNATAGVLVAEPRFDIGNNIASASARNVGNTISKNAISIDGIPATAALIDLGGDGPTANDDRDLDDGPNRLLNFPDELNVLEPSPSPPLDSSDARRITAAFNNVTVTGRAASPSGANATVEIFAVTRLRPDQNMLIIEGVAFLTQVTTDANGAFIALNVPRSPTDAYTATLTDQSGNTSELRFGCAGAARITKTLEGDGNQLNYGLVTARDQARREKQQKALRFTIQNIGCSPVALNFISLLRTGAGNAITDPNDTQLFSVKRVITTGGGESEEAINFGGSGSIVSLGPGMSETFRVRFNPVVPPLPDCKCTNNLHAFDVLPELVTSTIRILQNGKSETVNLRAAIKTPVRLINPFRNQPRQPPLVTLTRSGDELVAQFSIYDPNLDVHTASYEFMDKDGGAVRLKPKDADLRAMIKQTGVVSGESFTVIQKFSNANEHPEVRTIRITVQDNEATVSATSSPVVAASSAAVAQSRQARQSAVLLLPPVQLAPAPPQSVTRSPRAAKRKAASQSPPPSGMNARREKSS